MQQKKCQEFFELHAQLNNKYDKRMLITQLFFKIVKPTKKIVYSPGYQIVYKCKIIVRQDRLNMYLYIPSASGISRTKLQLIHVVTYLKKNTENTY